MLVSELKAPTPTVVSYPFTFVICLVHPLVSLKKKKKKKILHLFLLFLASSNWCCLHIF
ncbi:unnamed protein product [Brassica oleracea var. botrytis]